MQILRGGQHLRYMVETYLNGNMSVFRGLYHELNKDARKDFIDFLLSEVDPIYGGDFETYYLTTHKNDSDMKGTDHFRERYRCIWNNVRRKTRSLRRTTAIQPRTLTIA